MANLEDNMEGQLSLTDLAPESMEDVVDGRLRVVTANYNGIKECGWRELFSGYDELYGITFSSGIPFMNKVIDMFKHVELIFGNEDVVHSDIAAVITTQLVSAEQIVKSKAALKLAEKIENDVLEIRVSRDTKSHEKIYILKANDGRTRVITGSANMSASAFFGIQREDIIVFDNIEAYNDYKDKYDDFKEKCSDSLSSKVLLRLNEDIDYLRDNIDEVPILKTADQKMVFLEPVAENEETEVEFVADVRELRKEIKTIIPKQPKEKERIVITSEYKKAFKRKYDEQAEVKKEKKKEYPKLHIDYEGKRLIFNDKIQNMNPSPECIKNDFLCMTNLIDSFSSFIGDTKVAQRDYYRLLNWYFCSPFMPYLRYYGKKNDYTLMWFPTIAIVYGDSNGGKTTFIRLLSKLLSGVKVKENNSDDFTATNISVLKRTCEGIPIDIEDLAKAQYENNFEKVIKDDNWGISEKLFNYPSIVITTNKVLSLKPDISKRVVACRIDIKTDKNSGTYNSKKINESIKKATNSLYCAYVNKMFPIIDKMVEQLNEGDESYRPDILFESSKVLKELCSEYVGVVPNYISDLSYSDYFGDEAVAKNAIDSIKTAWIAEPKAFKVDKKKNTVTYSYPEGGRYYELPRLKDELPPQLEVKTAGKSLIMRYDVACEVFGTNFKRGVLSK